MKGFGFTPINFSSSWICKNWPKNGFQSSPTFAYPTIVKNDQYLDENQATKLNDLFNSTIAEFDYLKNQQEDNLQIKKSASTKPPTNTTTTKITSISTPRLLHPISIGSKRGQNVDSNLFAANLNQSNSHLIDELIKSNDHLPASEFDQQFNGSGLNSTFLGSQS